MLAVDTNLVIRYVVRDDADQAERARMIIDNESVWISTTVMLECEWVLRAFYRLTRARVADALNAVAGLPTVTCESPERLTRALAHFAGGMDFADALHWAASDDCAAFVTFDRVLAGSASLMTGVPVILA